MTCLRERTKFLALVLGAASVAAGSTAAMAETVKVRNIRVSETSGDTAVVIAASARPTFTTWKLEQPSRVVVELSGARLGDLDVPIDAGTYAVGLVSASVTEDESAGPRTRIVLTLRQASDYRVETKGSEITLKVIPHVRPAVAVATPQDAETKGRAEAKAKDDAEAKARAEAAAKALAQAKAEAEAQAKTLVLAKAKAEAQAKHEAQAKTEAQAQAKVEAQAKTEAQAQAKVEAQAKTEAQAQAKAEAQAKTEAQAQAKAEASARAAAQGRADEQSRLAALAKSEAETHARAQAKAEAQLKDEAKQRQAAQAMAEEKSRSEAAARSETERLRKELASAQRQTELARAEATAATAESHRQGIALAQAESKIKQAQAEVERSRKQTALAESETLEAKQREGEMDKAVKVAIAQVDARQKALDAMARSQDEQRNKLAAAEQLVGNRQASLRASEKELATREEESRLARARHDALSSDASKQSKAEAASVLAAAERQRKDAAKAAAESRAELAAAITSRKHEETRKEQQAQARKTEEERLSQAIALRKSEEARLAETGAERSRMEAERARLQNEQAQLESSRQSLLAEVKRLKDAATLAAQTAAAAPKPTPTAVALPKPSPVAPVPAMAAKQVAEAPKAAAPPVASRSRSITLRALSQIRSIDFVDEPARASVIIDMDDNASFTVERVAGRRLSLRLDHSDLPDSLARNLDATEYLGPVKIISSYRDPAARSTVRIDVDLAEDVPNRVRLDGGRIYWDFQKAQGKSPSLPANVVRPPTVLFVPARKVAGFFATVADATWLGQVTPPPYLIPPGSAPAAPAAAAPAAPPAGGASTTSTGAPSASGRYATLGKKRYTGRRIDLDFKGADIHNILRLLADVGQVNVVVADDVRGDVTIKMRDVPWDQALDVVLRSKGLGSVREGNLLRVAPLALLEKELEAEIARQKQIAEVVPVETRLIGVSYADASDLTEKAKDLLSPRGKISQDHRTNTMIVSDVSKNLQLIEDLVRNLDTQTSQVTIEARIVEANSNFSRQLGVQWGGTGFMDSAHGNPTGLTFPYNVGIGGGADDGSSPLGGLVPSARTGSGTSGSPNFLVNMPAPAGLGTGSAIGLTLGSVAGAFNLNLRLSAMETTGQVRILSSPRITTMDNVEATISQGVSIPVSVVSAMGAQTQFVDARLTLAVKPHVTNEGTVAMVINVTRNEPDFVNTGARGDPSIQKKEARTTMLVRDGDTAVIGGIYTRNTGLSNARVPFFSDIPVLGWFFRNKKENDNRSEFLVFITPRIANRARALGQ